MTASGDLPLTGVTIVALEHAIAAPLATRHLADLGARVIKVERPGTGDFARDYDARVRGIFSDFVWVNRSKESVVLDLKDEDGREALSRLLHRADVFVENLAPGAVARLGFGSERLRERHPSLIACSISGYGQTGEYGSKKAYDLVIQCETGVVSITGTSDEPVKVGIPIADIAAGMYAYSGILAALIRRERTGRGAIVDVSMLEALGEWVGFPSYYAMYGGDDLPRTGVSHSAIAPYGPFTTGDSEQVFVGVQNEREWERLCDVVLDEPELARDERFASNSARVANRDALTARIAAVASRVLAEIGMGVAS